MIYFVDNSGNYLGGWVPLASDPSGENQEVPAQFAGGVKVASCPDHASQVWDGESWLPLKEVN